MERNGAERNEGGAWQGERGSCWVLAGEVVGTTVGHHEYMDKGVMCCAQNGVLES